MAGFYDSRLVQTDRCRHTAGYRGRCQMRSHALVDCHGADLPRCFLMWQRRRWRPTPPAATSARAPRWWRAPWTSPPTPSPASSRSGSSPQSRRASRTSPSSSPCARLPQVLSCLLPHASGWVVHAQHTHQSAQELKGDVLNRSQPPCAVLAGKNGAQALMRLLWH